MTNRDMLFRAVGTADDELLERSELQVSTWSKKRWIHSVVAAVLMATVLAGAWRLYLFSALEDDPGYTFPDSKPMTVPEPDEWAMMMPAFFMIDGRKYVVQDAYYSESALSEERAAQLKVQFHEIYPVSDDFFGEYLGEVTDVYADWPKKKDQLVGHMEGTVSGALYTVKGVDPKLFVALKSEDLDYFIVYVSVAGLTFRTGADLLENYFHLTENCRQIRCSVFTPGHERLYSVELSGDRFVHAMNFIRMLNELKIRQYVNGTTEYEEMRYEKRNRYILSCQLKNGLVVELVIYPEGYVYWYHCHGVYMELPEEVFTPLWSMLDEVMAE